MARSNRRNFLGVFRSLGVDDAQRGADVSEDVQLVYIADDLRQTNYIYAGAGGVEAAGAGEHGFVRLECHTPGGLEIQQVTMNNVVPDAAGARMHIWTTRAEPTLIGPAVMTIALATDRLADIEAAPQGIITRATILSAGVVTDAFRTLDINGFPPTFFLPDGLGLNVAFGTPNIAVDVGIVWRELRLYPS